MVISWLCSWLHEWFKNSHNFKRVTGLNQSDVSYMNPLTESVWVVTESTDSLTKLEVIIIFNDVHIAIKQLLKSLWT